MQKNTFENRKLFSFTNIGLVAEFEARAFFSNKADLIRQLLYEPILYVLIFSNALSGLVDGHVLYEGQTVQYISFAYPGIIGLQLLRIFSHAIYRFTIDARWGLQSLKIVTGTGCFAYALGTLFVPLMIFLVQGIVSFSVYRIIGGAYEWIHFFKLILFGGCCVVFWNSIALLFAFLFKKYSSRDLFMNLTLLPMTLASPAFYALEKAPAYIQMIANINPLAHQINLLRSAFLSTSVPINSMLLMIICSFAVLFIGTFKMYKTEFYHSQL